MHVDIATLLDLSTRLTGTAALVLFIYGIMTRRIVTAQELKEAKDELALMREERDEFKSMLFEKERVMGAAIDVAGRAVEQARVNR